MKLFGKAKKAPPPSESIQKLRDTLTTLEKREDYLQKKCDMEMENARKNASKNRRAALMSLKKKKTYESQMGKISQARLTIETQIMYIENAAINLEAMEAMQLASSTLKQTQKNMSVTDVDNIMEDLREQMDVQEEISEAISQPLGVDLFDEDELEEELAELERMAADEHALDMPSTSGLADVSAPAQPVKSQKEIDEAAELAMLEAGMMI